MTISRKFLAALVVLSGWADILITLAGQPGTYWSGGLPMEDDPTGRFLLLQGWALFLVVGLAFHLAIGLAMLYIPRWVALAVGLMAFASGAVACTFWLAVILGGTIEAISTAVAVGMVGVALFGVGWNLLHLGKGHGAQSAHG
jgi:hypothetical protein